MKQAFVNPKPGSLMMVTYKDINGDVSENLLLLKSYFFGKNVLYTDYQCFMVAFDFETLEYTEFAVKGILDIALIEHFDIDSFVSQQKHTL